MSLVDFIKPFWPLLLTFLLPRALTTFNTLKLSYRIRPPPRPLTRPTTTALNILFFSIFAFLLLSLRRPSSDSTHNLTNVFAQTNSLATTPSEIVFTRLSLVRPNNRLTPSDLRLKNLLNTPTMRATYLTVGPEPLLACPFCAPTSKLAYTYHLFALPTQTLLPHFLHFTLLGLATSSPLTGPIASRHRSKFLLTSLPFLLLDIYLVTKPLPTTLLASQTSPSHANSATIPWSTYAVLRVLRPLTLCVLNALFAFTLWASASNRLIFFPFLANPDPSPTADPTELQHELSRTIQTIGAEGMNALAKLRGYTVARNAVVRDQRLKRWEDEYWAELARQERIGTERGGAEGIYPPMANGSSSNSRSNGDGDGDGDSDGVTGSAAEEIWLDEQVQAAVSHVLSTGGIDVARQRREIGAWVDSLTRGLERSNPETRG